MKLKKIILSLLILITFLIPVSFASWYISGLNTNIPATEESVSPVAYIVKDGERQEFNTLERALYTANTGDVVYIIPNIGTEAGKTNKPCVLNYDSTIKPGVTLFLPFNDKNSKVERVHSTPTHSPLNEKAFMKNHLIINIGVKLTNYGEIVLAGVTNGGGGSNSVNGQTSGAYSQITLRGGAKIINEKGSKIECYGAFKEEVLVKEAKPSILMKSGSIFYAPFVVNEHRGGSAYLKWYLALGSKSTPFNRWYLANVYTNITFTYGSEFIGIADLFANNQNNIANIQMLGTNSSYLVNMQQGTEVDFRCEQHTFQGESKSFTEHLNIVNIYGSFELNSMSMSIVGRKISTGDYLFPLSYHHNVTIHPFKNNDEAHVTLTQNLKMLPGCKFAIKKNVSAMIDRLAVYEKFDDIAYNSKAYYNHEYLYPAELMVEGTFSINTFGGYAQTKGDGSLLIINSNSSIDSPEWTGAGKVSINQQTISLIAKGDISSGAIKADLSSKTPYEGVKNAWMVSTRAKGYKIRFNVNAPTTKYPSYLWKEGEKTKEMMFYTFNTNSFLLKTLGVSPAFCEFYTMVDRSSDSTGSILISKNGLEIMPQDVNNVNKIYDVYAAWTETKFRVEYVLNFDESYTGTDKNKVITDPNLYTVTQNQTIYLQNVTLENQDYKVYKWYLLVQGDAYTDIRDGTINLENEFNNKNPTLTLYGFVSKESDIVSVTFRNNNTDYYPIQPIMQKVDIKKGSMVPNSFIALNIMSQSEYNSDFLKEQYFNSFIYKDSVFDENVIVNENITVDALRKAKAKLGLMNRPNLLSEIKITFTSDTSSITFGTSYYFDWGSKYKTHYAYIMPNALFSVESEACGKTYDYTIKITSGTPTSGGFEKDVIKDEGEILKGIFTTENDINFEVTKI